MRKASRFDEHSASPGKKCITAGGIDHPKNNTRASANGSRKDWWGRLHLPIEVRGRGKSLRSAIDILRNQKTVVM